MTDRPMDKPTNKLTDMRVLRVISFVSSSIFRGRTYFENQSRVNCAKICQSINQRPTRELVGRAKAGGGKLIKGRKGWGGGGVVDGWI